MAMRSIGAWRCMYRPLRSRSGRNSSSDSSPARYRRVWSRNSAHALVDERLVKLVVLVHGPIDYRVRRRAALNTVWFGAPLYGVMSLWDTSVRCF